MVISWPWNSDEPFFQYQGREIEFWAFNNMVQNLNFIHTTREN